MPPHHQYLPLAIRLFSNSNMEICSNNAVTGFLWNVCCSLGSPAYLLPLIKFVLADSRNVHIAASASWCLMALHHTMHSTFSCLMTNDPGRINLRCCRGSFLLWEMRGLFFAFLMLLDVHIFDVGNHL